MSRTTARLPLAARAADAFTAKTFAATAVTLLRKLILEGEFEPGERINEIAISERFQVSRSPVREALRSLAGEGIVTMVAGKGAFVAHLDESSVEDLSEVRVALECRAARLAAHRVTDQQVAALETMLVDAAEVVAEAGVYPADLDFHRAILSASGNAHLIELGEQVTGRFQLARVRSGHDGARAAAAIEEHREIVSGLAARDADRAAEAMEYHLARSAHRITELHRQSPGRSARSRETEYASPPVATGLRSRISVEERPAVRIPTR